MLSTNPYQVERLVNENKLGDSNNLGALGEAQVLMNHVRNVSRMINTQYGKAADKYICQFVNVSDYRFNEIEGDKFMGVIVYFSTEPLQEFLRQKTVPKKAVKIVNHVLKIIHREIRCLRGKIVSYTPGNYYAVWRYEEEAGKATQNPPSIEHEDLKKFFKERMQAKAEVAFSAIFTAIFRIKVFIREYMHYKHNKINFKSDYVIGFGMHAGSGIEGIVLTESKADPILCGKDISLTKRISGFHDSYKSDLLVTEYAYELLSAEVGFIHVRPRRTCTRSTGSRLTQTARVHPSSSTLSCLMRRR